MKSIKNKFKRDPAIASKYKETIKDYIDKGYAIKLTAEEVSNIKSITNYVPHHSVSNGNNSNKIRVVFDATVEYQNSSLNKHLLKRLDFLKKLVDFLRLRNGKYCSIRSFPFRKIETRLVLFGETVNRKNFSNAL